MSLLYAAAAFSNFSAAAVFMNAGMVAPGMLFGVASGLWGICAVVAAYD